jgi:hypothetical protein
MTSAGGRTVALSAASLAAVLGVVGCQSGTTGQSGPALPSIAFTALPTAGPSAQDSDGTEDDEVDDDVPAPACDVDTIAGVQEVVSEQLTAFRNRDFDAAFALASAQFQAISSVESLRSLIMDGRHEEVADAASHEFTECRMPGPGRALAAVSVTGMNRQTVLLVYTFVNEDGEWRILQSAPMSGHGAGSGEIESSPSAQSA